MPHAAIQCAVFDLDDTLFLERDYVRSGLRAVGQQLRRQTGRHESFGEWMWRRFAAGRRDGLFDLADAHFRLGLGADGVRELVAIYRGHRPEIEACPDAAEALAGLRRSGVRLALLSDGYLPAQQYKLDAIGLTDRFDAIVFTEAMGREAWKPSPRGFELIQERLAVAPSGCAYVADNPAKDFVAPNALGWVTVQWRREGQVHADNPPPPGGAPQRVVRGAGELMVVLGVKE